MILGDLRNDNQVIKWMLDELKQEEIKSVTVNILYIYLRQVYLLFSEPFHNNFNFQIAKFLS